MAEKFNQFLRHLNSRFTLPPAITHVAIFGQSGSGKSQTLKSLIERAFLRGNIKIVDLYADKADEGAYYALKSDHPFWDDREFPYGQKVTKAQEFPVTCLIPMCRDLPSELPDIYKVFTIPINTLNEKDLAALLGSDLSNSELNIWRKVSETFDKHTTLIDMLNQFVEAQKEARKKSSRSFAVHSMGVSNVFNMFSAFKKHMLFSDSNSEFALNLKNELKNKSVITSLMLRHFPRQYKSFIVNYFMHNIHEIMTTHEIRHTVIVVIREATDFLQSMPNSPQDVAVKNNMVEVIRKGRKDKLFCWLDTQNAITMDVIKEEIKMKICHKVDSIEGLKESLGSIGSLLLGHEDYARLMTFKPGKCYVLTDWGLFNPQMLPPLSRMSAVEGVDFYDIWRKEKGSRFFDTTPIIEKIKTEYSESELKWDKKLEERKMRIRQRKEMEKLKEEQARTAKEQEKEKQKLIKRQQALLDKKKRTMQNRTKNDIVETIDYIENEKIMQPGPSNSLENTQNNEDFDVLPNNSENASNIDEITPIDSGNYQDGNATEITKNHLESAAETLENKDIPEPEDDYEDEDIPEETIIEPSIEDELNIVKIKKTFL